MTVRSKVLLVALTAVFAALAFAAPSSAGTLFTAVCRESHVTGDDPVVFPGGNNAAHLHDFSGSTSTDENSTYASMLASGTTCNLDGDTAGYWSPKVYRMDGTPVLKKGTFAYYTNGVSAKNVAQIHPFPADLRMIADISNSFNAADGSSTGYRCDGDQDSQPAPYNCAAGKGFQIRIIFPDCMVNATTLDSTNHRSHMAYAGENGCPPSHPYMVPRLQLKSTYEAVPNLSQGLKLAPNPAAPSTYLNSSTYHADFWNTWDQAELTTLVEECINDGEGSPDQLPCEKPGNGFGPVNPNYPNPTPSAGGGNPPPPPPPPPPTSSNCDGGSTQTGTITAVGSGGQADESSTIDDTVTSPGTFYACLTGPGGTDFDLFLKKLQGDGTYAEVARSTNNDSTESIEYVADPGAYRWRVISASGTGTFTLKKTFTGAVATPPPAPASTAGNTDYWEGCWLEFTFGKTPCPKPTPYIALFTSQPSESGSGNEVLTSCGYVRAATTASTWGSPSAGLGTTQKITNVQSITVGTTTASCGTVTHFAGMDAATGGRMLWRAPLKQAVTIASGKRVRFPAGAVVYSVD